MKDEKQYMDELDKEGEFPEMPYNIQVAPTGGLLGNGLGKPPTAPKGGRPKGSQNVPVNKRNRGIKPPGQSPTSRVAAEFDSEIDVMSPEQVFDLVDRIAQATGRVITVEDI
jgi:hypothetical protein